ncbi:hypothetical protein ACHAWF_017211, partial [Thalassiosira exigua]
PTPQPSSAPTKLPTDAPTRAPIASPSAQPTASPLSSCFAAAAYDAIDADVARLASAVSDPKSRSHFLGGIVRLVAHDFMDYDPAQVANPMGPDGCFDPNHPANNGLPGDIWCANCTLTRLYDEKYSRFSRADFWIAVANAVVRQTSQDGALDLRETFRWGGTDLEACPGSGNRLPTPTGCAEVERVFLQKMGLSWRDAVALMGAHSLGRGEFVFSGHDGTWVDTHAEAMKFDKKYYEEIYMNSWRPRYYGQRNQDWTTGRPSDLGNTRLMLNTDMCLVYNIDNIATSKCCTVIGQSYDNGQDRCVDADAAIRQCPMYQQGHSRFEAREAVHEFLGPFPNDDNTAFYDAFKVAWRKATTVGQPNLSPLVESCS